MIRWGKLLTIGFLLLACIAACSSNKISPTPATVSFPSGVFVSGKWSWEFKSDGTFISSGPQGSETGTYTVNGNRVVITCQCCGTVAGTYTWSFDGTDLKFTALEDPCANRKGVVDASTWIHK